MKHNTKENARKELMEKVEFFDRQIEKEDSKLKQINTAYEYLSKLKENIDRCSEIVSKSLEKGYAKERFDNLINNGNLDFSKACGSFEEQADVFRQKISHLRCEKETAIREYEEKTYDEE